MLTFFYYLVAKLQFTKRDYDIPKGCKYVNTDYTERLRKVYRSASHHF